MGALQSFCPDMGQRTRGLRKKGHVEQASHGVGVRMEECWVKNLSSRTVSGVPRHIITHPCLEGFSHRT